MSIIDEALNEVPRDNLGFKSVAERIVGEEQRRLVKVAKSQKFGINFLDKTLRAIEVDDFVLIGAESGLGKTELTVAIAMANALRGQRVHFFALEASEDEIERRMKFTLGMSIYTQETGQILRLGYYDWYRGAAKTILAPYMREAEIQLSKLTNFETYYRNRKFAVKDFKKIFNGIANDTDLVLCDHLHYFDLDDREENRAVEDLMKEMRDLVLINEKPIVLVAHLRKLDRKIMGLAPELQDFHGTSSIGKIVTKAITLGKGELEDDARFSTYVRAVKCRQDGGVVRYLLKASWDAKANTYEEDFDVGFQDAKTGKFKPISDDNPNDLPLFITSQQYYEKTER